MLDQPALPRLGEVRRQEQQPVGPSRLGGLGTATAAGPPVAGASTGTVPPTSRPPPDHSVDLGRGQREALPGAAGREETGDVVLAQPRQVGPVAGLVEGGSSVK